MSVEPPPSIAVTLAINPPSFKLGTQANVELSVTAVSNASYPITIRTWRNILDPGVSQIQGSLVGVDQDTHEELILHMIDINYGDFKFEYTLGGWDDKYYVTLEPGQPRVFNAPFHPAHADERSRACRPLPCRAQALPGHRYLVDLQEGEDVDWWKKGRKEDVLGLPGQVRGGHEADGKPIVLSLDEPVEFKVLPLE
jgi:hypothetical protein